MQPTGWAEPVSAYLADYLLVVQDRACRGFFDGFGQRIRSWSRRKSSPFVLFVTFSNIYPLFYRFFSTFRNIRAAITANHTAYFRLASKSLFIVFLSISFHLTPISNYLADFWRVLALHLREAMPMRGGKRHNPKPIFVFFSIIGINRLFLMIFRRC